MSQQDSDSKKAYPSTQSYEQHLLPESSYQNYSYFGHKQYCRIYTQCYMQDRHIFDDFYNQLCWIE